VVGLRWRDRTGGIEELGDPQHCLLSPVIERQNTALQFVVHRANALDFLPETADLGECPLAVVVGHDTQKVAPWITFQLIARAEWSLAYSER
jgi:hypothetical protein